jgi:hypothetical protein
MNNVLKFIIIAIIIVVVACICLYLYLTRARDYKIEIKNFKTSELYELTFKDKDGNIIIRDNGKQAGVVKKQTTSLFKAENLEFDIGHVKLNEILISGKLNGITIIIYRDNESIYEHNNIMYNNNDVPLIYKL